MKFHIVRFHVLISIGGLFEGSSVKVQKKIILINLYILKIFNVYLCQYY
jgi:hypothetical protein